MVRGVGLRELGNFVPDELLAVRRPSSYVGQRNYITTLAAPTRSGERRTVWCESFAEQAHARDLLVAYDVEQFATQALRIEWTFPHGGLRVHIPDLLLRTDDGQMLLVDVSVRKRVENPNVQAIFVLTRATCEVLGWRYELRTPMPPQRVRNVQFIHSFRALEPVRGDQWREILRKLNGILTIHRVASLEISSVGAGGGCGVI